MKQNIFLSNYWEISLGMNQNMKLGMKLKIKLGMSHVYWRTTVQHHRLITGKIIDFLSIMYALTHKLTDLLFNGVLSELLSIRKVEKKTVDLLCRRRDWCVARAVKYVTFVVRGGRGKIDSLGRNWFIRNSDVLL